MGKEGLDLVGLGTRRHVKVFGLDSKQPVTDTAASQVGDKSVLTQRLNNRAGMLFIRSHLGMVTCQTSGINGEGSHSSTFVLSLR